MAVKGTIKVGSKVRLKWNGFPQVPRYLDGAIVTVVCAPRYRSTRAGGALYVRVRRDHSGTDWTERTVMSNQISEVIESE